MRKDKKETRKNKRETENYTHALPQINLLPVLHISSISIYSPGFQTPVFGLNRLFNMRYVGWIRRSSRPNEKVEGRERCTTTHRQEVEWNHPFQFLFLGRNPPHEPPSVCKSKQQRSENQTPQKYQRSFCKKKPTIMTRLDHHHIPRIQTQLIIRAPHKRPQRITFPPHHRRQFGFVALRELVFGGGVHVDWRWRRGDKVRGCCGRRDRRGCRV